MSSRRTAAGLAVAVIVGTLLAVSPQYAFPAAPHAFEPGCSIPYASIAVQRPIDTACDRFGESSSYRPKTEAHRQANAAKNNLCAVGPAVPVTISDFRGLMTVVDDRGVEYGRNQLPADRSVLRNLVTKTVNGNSVLLGEGKRVVFVGYVAGTSYAQRESVNCRRKKVENDDIHISLVPRKNDPRCKGIVAEMIPHFRPSAWTPSRIKAIQRPVRVSGHLFFDAPHVPCNPDGTIPGGNSRRVSLWEIHPVYSFEVCKNTSLSACRVDLDADWNELTNSN